MKTFNFIKNLKSFKQKSQISKTYLKYFCSESKVPHYDFFVIGGGSGGLAAAKEAAEFGVKVGVADFVVPSPQKTKWGLGGTCVNVGCIPKKLFHYSALKMEELEVYPELGLEVEYKSKIKKFKTHNEDDENLDEELEKKIPIVNWEILRNKIQQYVKKLNFGHRGKLRELKIDYHNKLASFESENKIKLVDNKGNESFVTADKILISVGGRPSYGDYKGSKDFCISSDDLFSLKNNPGKNLVIGASYIALESAGFLNGLGLDTTVMVRSILLRGFDQDIAHRIGEHMNEKGVKFINKSVPIEFNKNEDNKIIVKYKNLETKEELQEEYDTVLLAIGREAVTHSLNLDKIGVKFDNKTKKIIVNEKDETSVNNIYSIGDCAYERPELTPPAIQVSFLLSFLINRLEDI